MISTGMGIAPAVLIAVAAAGVFGGLQGLLIAVTGINSLVFTIGTLIGLRGFALIISNENSVTMPIPRLGETDWLAQRVLGRPFAAEHHHVRGVHPCRPLSPLHGVGPRDLCDRRRARRRPGRRESRSSGRWSLPSPCPARLPGSAAPSRRFVSAAPRRSASIRLLLSAVTACLMGGIALEGGRGNVVGIFIGLLTLRFLVGGVASLGAPYWLQSLAIGALLILVIVVQMAIDLFRRRGSEARLAPQPA